MAMRNNVSYLSYLLLVLIIAFLTYQNYKINSHTEDKVALITDINKKENVTNKIFYDQVIESLKKNNKSLYDSIKDYKNQVDYLTEFKYKKKYVIDTVYIDTIKKNSSIKTFEYTNNKNDTLNYSLKIGSTVEPNWYTLKFTTSNKFTIINRKEGNLNNTSIAPQNKGEVEDVTVFKKKTKNNPFKRFAVGPSISFGYDFAKKEPEFLIGISITYNLFGK